MIVFDLDGTLIDSRRDIADAANELLVRSGAPPLTEEAIGRMVGDGAATLVDRAFEAAGVPRAADALDRFLAIYAAHLTVHTRPYDGMAEALDRLRRRATLGVLTNKPRHASVVILERLGLLEYFGAEFIVGGDGPLPRKPDPGGLQELMRRAGVDRGDTLMVGDSPIDRHTARAAGTPVCIVRYGFGFERFSHDALGPDDYLVDSPSGLVRLLGIATV